MHNTNETTDVFARKIEFKRCDRWIFTIESLDDPIKLNIDPFSLKSIKIPTYISKERCWTPLVVKLYDFAKENDSLWKWILSKPSEKETIEASIKYLDGRRSNLASSYISDTVHGTGDGSVETLIYTLNLISFKLKNLDYKNSNIPTITMKFATKNMKRKKELLDNADVNKMSPVEQI